MDDLGALLMLFSLLGTLIGLVGLIKGNIKFLKIFNRKKAAQFILICFVLFIAGGIMLDTGTSDSPDIEPDDVAQVEQIDEAQDTEELETDAEEVVEVSTQSGDQRAEDEPEPNNSITMPDKTVSGNLEVHFIDVGQADSILIKAPGGNMIIDAGNNADSNLVTSYIKKQGIDKLDVVVGTHPHEDHIGGLDAVIDTFDIGKVYMPKVSHTTKTFEDVLLAIQDKGLKISSPTSGTTFNLGQAEFTILAPNSSSYDDLNNYSVVLKMQYGSTSFLFTGDAEDVSEREMLNKGFDLSADVLKIGHHGSDSSTTSSFLKAVSPKFAVIMVGADNDYGHPTKTIMDRLKDKNVTVYRTDENGTVIAISDGTNVTFNVKPGSYSGSSGGGSTGSTAPTAPAPDKLVPTAAESSRTVYWTPNGKSYHYTDKCSTLSRSKTILSGSLSESPKSDPCDRCAY